MGDPWKPRYADMRTRYEAACDLLSFISNRYPTPPGTRRTYRLPRSDRKDARIATAEAADAAAAWGRLCPSHKLPTVTVANLQVFVPPMPEHAWAGAWVPAGQVHPDWGGYLIPDAELPTALQQHLERRFSTPSRYQRYRNVKALDAALNRWRLAALGSPHKASC